MEISGNDEKLRAALRRASRQLRSVGSLLLRVGALATAAAAAFAPLGIASVRAASDAEESLSRFAAVFGSQTDKAAKFADDLARRVGRSSVEVKDALATYQSFFVGLGFGAEEARGLSQQMAELALDFASFNNLSDDEALGRFISALSGSSEVLDRFGINTKQAALQQELLRLGIRKAWTQVTEQEKALARLNIIMRTMGDQGAVGDAVRTAGSFANQMKRLRANAKDTAIEIGRALIPVLKPIVTTISTTLGIVKDLIRLAPTLTAGVFAVAAATGLFGLALLAVGAAASFASIALGGLATVAGVIGAVFSPVVLIVTLATAAITALGVGIVVYSGIGARALQFLGAAFQTLRAVTLPVLAAIAESIQAGNIEGAVRILWAGIALAWEAGRQGVIDITLEFGASLLVAMKRALNGVMGLFDQAVQSILVSWLKLVDQIAGTSIGSTVDAVLGAGVLARAAERDAELEKLQRSLEGLKTATDGAGDARIAAARRQLQEAIDDAREANEQLKATANGSGPGFDFSGLAKAVSRSFSSSGAFSALGGAAFAAGSPAERTAQAAEKIQASTTRIEREVSNAQGPVFT